MFSIISDLEFFPLSFPPLKNCPVVSLVCQSQPGNVKRCRGGDLLNEINNYLKYYSNSTEQMERFRVLLEPGYNRYVTP